jgi:lysophospholipase L1-like esterase
MKRVLIRHIKITLILVISWLGLWICFETGGKYLIKSAYHETLPINGLNRILSGRNVRSEEYYITYADRLFFQYSKTALFLSAVILLVSFTVHAASFFGLLKELTLSICTVMLVLLLFEVLFRLFDIRGYYLPKTQDWYYALLPRSERLPGVLGQFKPYSTFRVRYESNPRGYFDKDNGIAYRLNNYGFRDHDYTQEKPEGVKRIIVLGDSFTYGVGVRSEHTFCNRLKQLLAEAGFSVEVLNLSVSGWCTRDEVAYLQNMGMKFSPDLILVAYVLNDADYAGGLDVEVWTGFRQWYEKSSLRWSYFLSYVYAKVAQRTFVKSYVPDMTNRSRRETDKWTASFMELDRGKELAGSNRAQFAVIILPFMYDFTPSHPFLPIHHMIEKHCKQSGIPVRDLLPVFMGHDYVKLWVHATDSHPNEIGHKIIAEALADFVLSEHLLENPKNDCRKDPTTWITK